MSSTSGYTFGDRFTGKVTVTKHACQRARERFGVTAKAAESWVRTNVNHATYVGEVVRENGVTAQLFAKGGAAFVINAEDRIVITVYKPEPQPSVVEKVRNLVAKELRKCVAEKRKTARRAEVAIAELNVELAELRLRLLRARSESRINAIKARIAAVEQEIELLREEADKAARKSTALAKGVVAYV